MVETTSYALVIQIKIQNIAVANIYRYYQVITVSLIRENVDIPFDMIISPVY